MELGRCVDPKIIPGFCTKSHKIEQSHLGYLYIIGFQDNNLLYRGNYREIHEFRSRFKDGSSWIKI